MIMKVDGRLVRLDNVRTGHVVWLGHDTVGEHRMPGVLRLACQLTPVRIMDPIWGGRGHLDDPRSTTHS